MSATATETATEVATKCTTTETAADTKSTGKKVQVLDDFVNSDLHDPRLEYVFRTPFLANALESLLKDKRDVPMLCLQLNILEYIIPGIFLVYYVNMKENPPPLYIRNLIGLIYVLGNTILFLERFILMLHYQSHRSIFIPKVEFLNAYVNWLLVAIYGIPCGVYRLHHCIMHHIENNHELDISSTEFYQRDNPLHFLWYYIRFSTLIYFELPLYTIKTKRWVDLRRITTGLCVWVSTIVVCTKINFLATVWVLIVPVFIVFLAMSFGNWSQHMFVDPSSPESNYHLTYNCIDTFVNRRTFNDGYHVIHHYNARMHWSELPEHFHSAAAQKRHQEEGALTFRGIHFFDVGLYAMTGRLHKLAEHYVHLGPRETAPTVDEVVEKMHTWLKPMKPVKAKKKAS